MAKLFEFQAESLPSWNDGNYMMPWTQETLNEIQKDGASQVVIVPTVYMDSLTSSVVYRDNTDPGGHSTDEWHRTESDASIRVALQQIKARGMEAIFKLHVNIQSGEWNAWINPANVDQWFDTYKQAAVHYAQLAQEAGVTAFAIGNEIESMTGPQYRDKWIEVIDAVRAVYTGKLTYAATWTEAFHVSFWDHLDYVGANPYISFTNSYNPTLQQMVDGWTKPSTVQNVRDVVGDKPVIEALRDLAIEKGKPLIFTETGFRSMDGNNREPWSTEPNGTIDPLEQANMFKAFFKILTDYKAPWIGGYWLWNYDAGQLPLDPSPDNGYYTHGKVADSVIETYLKNPVPIAGRVLTGTAAAETISGGFNNDTINGSGGNDTLVGAEGADTFIYFGGGGSDIISDFQSGTTGDKIRLINTSATSFVTLDVTSVEDGYRVVFADGGSIHIKTTATLVESWFEFGTGTGTSGPSTRPSAGDDEITGTARNDVVNALAGDDLIDGLAGNDRLFGGEGSDTLQGGEGADKLYGNAGDDVLDGANGADRLEGGDGDDMLTGGAGKDTVLGGQGIDLLNGNSGNDVLYGQGGDDMISGGTGNDTVKGGTGNDKIDGDDGNDVLYGEDGDDVLSGWFGNDNIRGGNGNDVIEAGGGNDKLRGGAGADRFVFGAGMEHDTIYDFSIKGGDMLIIQGHMNGTTIGDNFAAIQSRMKQVGRDTVINLGGEDQLTLINVKAASLTAEHFWFW
ncbi:glycoside hydrolase family 113 [Microvirga flavescens]|uniref:glycoside hydrolase family 113 n=1 Tax=Microvirga flavescens TaxID=2249811 RepID=UPI000DD88C90|nr:hypothetical protein [Microvirga flavescens]